MCLHLAASGRLQWPPAAGGLHPPSTGLQLPAASSGQMRPEAAFGGHRRPCRPSAASVFGRLRRPASCLQRDARPPSAAFGGLRPPSSAFSNLWLPKTISGRPRRPQPALGSLHLRLAALGCSWMPVIARGDLQLPLAVGGRLRRHLRLHDFSGLWPPSGDNQAALTAFGCRSRHRTTRGGLRLPLTAVKHTFASLWRQEPTTTSKAAQITAYLEPLGSLCRPHGQDVFSQEFGRSPWILRSLAIKYEAPGAAIITKWAGNLSPEFR